MKKLLSILTITTLTASIPAPLLGNTVQTRAKRDVSTLTSNSNNDYLPIKQINGVNDKVKSIIIDSKNNIYFGTNNGAFVLKQGETTPTKINGFVDVFINYAIAVDSKDNIYFGTNNGAYKLSAGSTNVTSISTLPSFVQSIIIDSKDNIYFGKLDGAYKLSAGETTPTKINGIDKSVNSIAVDSNDSIYFETSNDVFVLKHGETTPTKINGFVDVFINHAIAVDSKDNIYFGKFDGAFVLKHGETTPTKINGIDKSVNSIVVDSNDNIYFGTSNGAFVLKHGATTAKKINGINDKVNSITIDKAKYLYFGTDTGAYIIHSALTSLEWVKTQSQFTVESGKTQTWTRPDLLSVDGELNIDIVNTNIDKIIFDNVQQPQTSKQWKINVKPETAPRDHNLQVTFTLDGKQYTSEIIVSMQAKIDPPPAPVQQNLSELIKTTDLGNIIDNNDNTIFLAVNKANSNIIDDFSQIEISKKDDHSATLTAKKDSKSYKGLVEVKYNVVPATVVDLKIELKPTVSSAIVNKDYLAQLDNSKMTNKVNTFYYANSESVITMVKPTPSSVITGVVYGCDDKWNKTTQSSTIDPASGIKLDGSQLSTNDGKYVVELSDNLGHTNNVYLQIAPKQKIPNYFDTDNGKQFEIWAKANGHDNIRGYSASQLNNLFVVSKTWKQSLSHLDLKLDNFVVDNIKNVTQDEIDNYKTKMLASVKEQVEKYVPDVVENTDYKIQVDTLVAGDWTVSKDVKVQAVDGSTKLLSFTAKTIPVQQKEQPTPPTPAPDNNKKGGLTGLAIVGIVLGSLAGLGLLGWLFKRFVINPFILKPIREKKQKAWRIREDKALAEMQAEEEAKKAKRGK